MRFVGLLLVLVACGDNTRLHPDASSPDAPPDAAPDAPIDAPPAVCGDNMAQGTEMCDGTDLHGTTCASLGHAPGTLVCAADCSGFDMTGCTGAYDAANTGFTGTVCFNGLKFSTPNLTLPYVLACTEADGVFKTTLGNPVTWASMNAGGITNLHGRGIATNPNGPPIYFITDPSTTNNGFRSSNQGGTWVAQSINDSGTPRELFAFAFRAPLQNLVGAWDPVMGATVLHGNTPGVIPHFVGAMAGSVMGTPRAFANGGTSDVYVAVYGQTPAGAAATGGIYRACDLTTSSGGTYEERDTGIAAGDLGRIWSLTVDPASVTGDVFMCGATTTAGFATTYYAALRGGGQIYKTVDGGASWAQSNTGLPAGAEVYDIAVDCFNTTTTALCHDHNAVYAATSVGLYRSSNGGARWAVDGFEGKVVRAVTLDPQPAGATRVLVGVDDPTGIYQSR